MADTARIYLDNAATSWPKPESVYQAVEAYQRNCGAPAGRSVYAEAMLVERQIQQARVAVAELLGIDDPARVVFTFNGTDSLNLAIAGLLKPGDHVVTSVVEHNSVLRPLHHFEQAGGQVARVGCDAEGLIDPESVRQALLPETRLVALIHASNVTGALQPIAEIGALLRAHPARLLVDAAQSLGHLPIDFEQLGCDLLAAPGHKGLLGPLGTGILALGPGMEQHLETVRQGGTGTVSQDVAQPETLPDKYESGNHNVGGILGLAAGIAELHSQGLEKVQRHATKLTQRLVEGLGGIAGVTLYGPSDPNRRVGVVSLNVEGYDPQEVALMLESGYRIQARAGLHCAPLMHGALGTLDSGGSVRLSPGVFTTETEVEAAIAAIAEIAASSLAS